MSILDIARLVIYRFHEKGMEVFLVNSDLKNDPDIWRLPNCDTDALEHKLEMDEFIEIDIEGSTRAKRLIAIEGDWHNMPSIRGLVKHDVKMVKSMVKESLPGIDKGAFFAVKEVVKKVMPAEYRAIKELKDVLIDRNSIKNI
jgi:hypothetical protein